MVVSTSCFKKRRVLVPASVAMLFMLNFTRWPLLNSAASEHLAQAAGDNDSSLVIDTDLSRANKVLMAKLLAADVEKRAMVRERQQLVAEVAELKGKPRAHSHLEKGFAVPKGTVVDGVADDAAAEGCIPCWVKPGLDSLDKIGEAYGKKTCHNTDKVGGTYKWKERGGVLKHGESRKYWNYLHPEAPACPRLRLLVCMVLGATERSQVQAVRNRSAGRSECRSVEKIFAVC